MSSKVLRARKHGYNMLINPAIADTFNFDELLGLINRPPNIGANNLAGRASVQYSNISGAGHVAIKYYVRGGVFGKLVTRRYLKLGPTRGELEFGFLEEVRSLGVNAPKPLVAVDKGWPFYQAWLITEVIPDTVTLAELSIKDEDRASRLLLELVRQISIMIRAGIWHVDLHPGNVLVDRNDALHILDFDKAEKFSGPDYQLRDRYLFRWRRAAIKHRLPDLLTEVVCLGLRSYHGEQHGRLT